MGAGNFLRDAGERRIGVATEGEALLGHGHDVRTSAPFPNQPGAGLDLRSCVSADLTVSSELGRQGSELPRCGLRQASMRQLLNPVSDRANQQITAEARRVASEQTPPFHPKVA